MREPIAIIGMGCRFPGGVNSPEMLWKLLCDERSAITEVPASRYNFESYYDPRPATPGKIMSKWGGYLDQIDRFDPLFFGISPREAECMDPQQRLLLEVAWEAFEDAGQIPNTPQILETGVFIGMWLSDFEARLFRDPSKVEFHMTTGSGRYSASGRLSYVFGLQGPSFTIDAACSSSLVAVHLAVQSLRNGECNLALAGGANVILQPHITIAYSQSRMMSPDGSCKFGDARANGYVRSEGAGILVLKRLSEALADHDPIHAVIRGSSTNNDGRTSGYLTTPGRVGQEEMLRKAYQDAHISAGKVQYIEAHGTGTPAGDPVEIGAIGAVVAEGRPDGEFCTVGSIKTNLGHIEGAAGIAGLMKVVLALKNRMIPASLNFESPNPNIPWESIPVRVQNKLTPWPAEPGEAIGGVSSFGITGTNAHVVLQEAPERPLLEISRANAYLLPISAQTPKALSELVRAFERIAYRTDLNDLCYSASVRRLHHSSRIATIARTSDDLLDALEAASNGESRPNLLVGPQEQSTTDRRLVFVFAGQGSHWLGMGRQLYEQEAHYREALDRCVGALRLYTDWDLLDILLHADRTDSHFESPEVIQPLLFAVQVALAELWRFYGIEPDAVIGHSMGEIAAAHIAGVLSLEDAAKIICYRSQLMKKINGQGAMAMVELPHDEAIAQLGEYAGKVEVAVINGPHSCVLSGEPASLAAVVARLEKRDVFCRPVKIKVAAHSPQMDALRPELVQSLEGLQAATSRIPTYSTVTGALQDGSAFDNTYWGANLRQPVLFMQAIRHALEDGYNTFIEISPHPVLLPSIQRGLSDYGLDENTASTIVALPSTRRGEEERFIMLESLGTLYVQGLSVTWQNLYPQGGRHIQLPSYPWQRDSYWLETQFAHQIETQPGQQPQFGQHPLLGQYRRSAIHTDTHFWETEINGKSLPYFPDHRVAGNIVLPAAAFGEMALAAIADLVGAGQVEELKIEQALVLSETDTRTIQVAVTADLSGTYIFQCLSCASESKDSDWQLHATAILRAEAPKLPESFSLEVLKARCHSSVSKEEFYSSMERRGLSYGPTFQVVTNSWHSKIHQEAIAHIRLAETVQSQDYHIHPTLLDGCLQLLVALLPSGDETYLPVSFERIHLYDKANLPEEMWGYAQLPTVTGDFATGDVFLLNAAGGVIVGVHGLRLQRVKREEKIASSDHLLYHLRWQAKSLPIGSLPRPSQIGSWLVMTNDDEIGDGLLTHLQAQGEQAVIVSVGPEYRRIKAEHYTIRPDEPEDFKRLLQEIGEGGLPTCRGVLHMWGVESNHTAQLSSETLSMAESYGSISALYMVQALAQTQWEKSPQLWLFTRGTQSVEGEANNIAFSTLWGLGAVIANEHADLHPIRIDLDLHAPVDVKALLRELWINDGEDQIALRGTERYVARLVKGLPTSPIDSTPVQQWATAAEQPFHAEIATPGLLDSIQLYTLHRSQPGPGQVEIEVKATGLNFRDVLTALGALQGQASPLGLECAGIVTAVGEGVDTVQVGDAVMAIAFASLATHTLADARLVVHKPDRLTFVEAASVPIAFLTAYYSLIHQARLSSGERVLIHAATGGVGLAAVQLAQHVGAEIYATAGSPEKRAYLQSLGVKHIMDSRSLAFAADILKLTDGEGVDVVLNSLAGEAITKGLAILRPYGRFIEIGTRDIYENRQIGLMPFQKNLSYFAVDLNKMARERPSLLGTLLRQMMEYFESGEFVPIPIRAFAIDEMTDAFRFMAQAKHIGKIVLEVGDKAMPISHAPTKTVRNDSTYLITGGLGALGLLVARWLVDQGARHLVLTGRRGASASTQAAIRDIESVGTVVEIVKADVADHQALADLLQMVEMKMPPLRGVVHAAGILDDSFLIKMDRERMQRAMSPKVDGAWNLHTLTEDYALDFFVLFSSATTLLGMPAQGNYAAGNAFMDSLAYYRHTHGLPALSINWGPWSEVGLAAAETIRGDRLLSRGLGSLSPQEGMATFHSLMTTSVLPQVAVMSFDVQEWINTYTSSQHASLLAALYQKNLPTAQQAKTTEQGSSDIRQALHDAQSGRQRRSLLESYIRQQVAHVLRIKADRIGLRQPVRELGIDSLLALELRNRLEAGFKVSLSATLIFNYPTVAALALYLTDKLGISLEDSIESQTSLQPDLQSSADSSSTELDVLSREEIEALLENELRSIDDSLLKGN